MTTNRSTAARLGRRLLVAVALLCAVSVLPSHGAPLTVSATNLTVFHTCVLSGISGSSTSSFDSFVNQANATQTNGTGTTMTVNTASGSKNTRAYVQFDLTTCTPTIPSTATIRTAMLRLYITQVPNACLTQDVFAATAAWTEAAISWSNQPFGTTSNNPPSAQATASMVAGTGCAANASNNAYVTGWNVTSDVSKFVAGTATNHGWMIRDDVEDSSTAHSSTYAAREGNNAAHAPQLVIDYTT